jgi:hypothetical protein
MESLQLIAIKYGIAGDPRGPFCSLYAGPESVKTEELFKEFDEIKNLGTTNTFIPSPLEDLLSEKGFKKISNMGIGLNANETGDIVISSHYKIYDFLKPE